MRSYHDPRDPPAWRRVLQSWMADDYWRGVAQGWIRVERKSNVCVGIFMPFDGPECPPDEVLLERERLSVELEGGTATTDARELRNTWLWDYRDELKDRCRKRGGDWHRDYAAHLLNWRASVSVLKREDPESYALFAPLYAEREAQLVQRQRESGKK